MDSVVLEYWVKGTIRVDQRIFPFNIRLHYIAEWFPTLKGVGSDLKGVDGVE
jgi:hypothetical protein